MSFSLGLILLGSAMVRFDVMLLGHRFQLWKLTFHNHNSPDHSINPIIFRALQHHVDLLLELMLCLYLLRFEVMISYLSYFYAHVWICLVLHIFFQIWSYCPCYNPCFQCSKSASNVLANIPTSSQNSVFLCSIGHFPIYMLLF